ncbi:hypothetical protein FA073_08280 [Pseudomonas aeruginosa]|nr:hypothetical protein [Pseudomonas aeruginosa]RQF13603.1 hypothetical protein IPC279_21115 [Pseudomonas aeruginosa]
MAVLLSKMPVFSLNESIYFTRFLKSLPMKTPTTLIRSVLLICFLGLMTACGGGEKGAASESAEHGHSHE